MHTKFLSLNCLIIIFVVDFIRANIPDKLKFEIQTHKLVLEILSSK